MDVNQKTLLKDGMESPVVMGNGNELKGSWDTGVIETMSTPLIESFLS